MRLQSADCVCGSGLGDSHTQTEGLKFSDVANEVENTQTQPQKLFVCKTTFMSVYAQMMNPPTLQWWEKD